MWMMTKNHDDDKDDNVDGNDANKTQGCITYQPVNDGYHRRERERDHEPHDSQNARYGT